MKRAEKIAFLSKLINGRSSQRAIKQLREEKRDAWFMVVTEGRDAEPMDWVEVRPRHGGIVKKIHYKDFVNDPIYYGCSCIVLDI
ncbi:hypothetical protein [Larkinella arboricola]|uniref:hypothetical protein n=1 Tax=Larkinella arboricola TaxID=643671 RepID=UPI000DBA2C2B|nr:hypothetical protein [Larkinella arboricola]